MTKISDIKDTIEEILNEDHTSLKIKLNEEKNLFRSYIRHCIYESRLKNQNKIKLPNYWKGLVHTDSISVQLQPIGAHQNIIIKRWDDEFVYLQAQGGLPINCFYHVYAERKDINPLITEYEGDTWNDYPDPNYKPDAVNPRYDDPAYAGKPNTITT